jgi:hypothetical protein
MWIGGPCSGGGAWEGTGRTFSIIRSICDEVLAEKPLRRVTIIRKE